MARQTQTPSSSTTCVSNNPLDGEVEWTWDKSQSNDFIDLVNNDRDVKFHRTFSSGTAAVRGNKELKTDQYFWEVEMITPVYGTDMMIGIGTSETDVSQVLDRFISFLGTNDHTWGLSYTGLFHHNGESRCYSSRFGQGSIIGVHLDMWHGTLSYYKNKKHLGIATRGLNGKTLYAMASSTAACSGMRIVSSCSFPSSLQFLCCARLRELIPDEKNVLKEVNLPPGLKRYLKDNLSWLLDRRHVEAYVPHPSLEPRRRHWVYEPNRTLNRYFYEHYDHEAEVELNLFNSRGVDTFFVVGSSDFVLCNCNRFLPRSDEIITQSHRNCVTGHDDSVEKPAVPLKLCSTNRPGTSVEAQDVTLKEPSNSPEASTSSEDYENADDKRAKRLRFSYNYIVGLSDADSE